MFDRPIHFLLYEAEGGWCEFSDMFEGWINPYPADKC